MVVATRIALALIRTPAAENNSSKNSSDPHRFDTITSQTCKALAKAPLIKQERLRWQMRASERRSGINSANLDHQDDEVQENGKSADIKAPGPSV